MALSTRLFIPLYQLIQEKLPYMPTILKDHLPSTGAVASRSRNVYTRLMEMFAVGAILSWVFIQIVVIGSDDEGNKSYHYPQSSISSTTVSTFSDSDTYSTQIDSDGSDTGTSSDDSQDTYTIYSTITSNEDNYDNTSDDNSSSDSDIPCHCPNCLIRAAMRKRVRAIQKF